MRIITRLFLIAGLALATALPVLAVASDKSTLVDVLAGKVVPLTFHLKDMASGWATFICNSVQDPASQWMGMMQSTRNGMQADHSMLFTRGQTLELGGELYLVAYQRPNAPFTHSMMMMQVRAIGMGEPAQSNIDTLESNRLTPEMEVALQLLNMHVMGHMKDIRLFNMKEMNAALDKAELLAHEEQSLSQLNQLAQITQMYAQQNNGKLPLLDTIGHFQLAIHDLLGGRQEMMQHLSYADIPYQTNIALTGHKLADFPNPGETVLVFEAQPWPDGKRGVAYLDGHVRFVPAAEWEKLQVKVK